MLRHGYTGIVVTLLVVPVSALQCLDGHVVDIHTAGDLNIKKCGGESMFGGGGGIDERDFRNDFLKIHELNGRNFSK